MSQQGCQEGRLSHTSDQQHTSRCSSASDFPQGGYGQLTFQHGIIGSGAGRAQRPSIIRGSSAFSSHGGRFKSKPKLADFGDIPDVAKHEWEVGAGHQRDFNLGVRKSYMSDVGKHYKSVAHEQRSTFLRQRLEAAGRYAASGLPPRSTHLHLSLPSSCGDITSVSNEEQQYMEQCMQHNSPQNMAQNIGQNMGQEQKESIGADEAPSHDAQMDQHNKGYAGSNVPGIPRPMTPMAYASTKPPPPARSRGAARRGARGLRGAPLRAGALAAAVRRSRGRADARARRLAHLVARAGEPLLAACGSVGGRSGEPGEGGRALASGGRPRSSRGRPAVQHEAMRGAITHAQVLDWDLKPLASPAANRPTTSRQEKAEQIAMELISFEYAHRAHL
eukprot:gene31710-6914_t